MTNTLLQTIKTDLAAGASYLEKEVQDVALGLWNIFKGVFIALEPAEAMILQDVLSVALATAGTGSSIEQVETAALNTAKAEERAVLIKAGSGVVQTIIAGLRATSTPAPAAPAP